jgi:alpha-beta hydrolase superfamily lysophospholipase
VEEPVQIGPGEGLSAVLARPERLDASRPVFILLNAGLLHRVGPFRLHVQLSRRLAQQGFAALRLDLSGLGYTPARQKVRGVASALEDADVVFSWLESSFSATQPVLLGSCSGADIAHRIAVADERVQGCAFLDGYAYHNSLSTLHYYSTRLHRPDLWRKWFQSQLGKPEADVEEDEVFWQSETPSLNQFRSELAGLIARELPLLYVYSGSVREYRYETQFFDVCPEARNGRVGVKYLPQADHTYSWERDRGRLLDTLCDWAREAFPHD